MSFNINDNVEVIRDSNNRVRQLQHYDQPYSNADAALPSRPTPQELANKYLEDVADVFGFVSQNLTNLTATSESTPTAVPSELRFKEEKEAIDSTVVSYDQTLLGLPIWQAGVTVRMKNSPILEVTSSQNEYHYDAYASEPSQQAAFTPEKIDSGVLLKSLGLDYPNQDCTINGTKLLVYCYEPNERLDPALNANQSKKSFFDDSLPTIALLPVSKNIEPQKHYVVTEVLFTFGFPNQRKYNWRAFIEVETGEVLYLRALVACVATGCIFLSDPVTRTGRQLTAASATNDLDAERSNVNLGGLVAPTGAPLEQELSGQYVKLVDSQPPSVAAPKQRTPFDFCYGSKSTNFAASNAYYHCDNLFRTVADMGFNLNSYFDGTTFPVPVDFYALNGRVNAQAPGNVWGNGSGGFLFGIAQAGQSMGIAADVRVVWHEFGHTLLWDHVNSPNFGFAHSAGDSLAAILYDPDSNATDRFLTFPFMAASNPGVFDQRRHDRPVEDGWAWGGNEDDTQYGSEQILATTLFRIYQLVGGDSTDVVVRRAASRYMAFLIIKAIGTLTFMTRNPEVYVNALIDADISTINFEGRPGGTLSKLIRWSFEKQGLYQPLGTPLPIRRAGAPPRVDVYVDNGRLGEYGNYAANFTNEIGLWNRLAQDGGTTHETPNIGSENYIYVRVKNRGTSNATNVSLQVYRANHGSGQIWPNDWNAITAIPVQVGLVASGGQTLAGPIAWTPDAPNEDILVSISAAGDLSNADRFSGIRNIPASLVVPLDNNLAQRKM